MATAVGIENISKAFGSAPPVVDDLSLSIEPGEIFFLLGPSGCGKTTLLRMIAGFLEPTGGRVTFDGRDVTYLPPPKRGCGMVFQSYALWPHMSVRENVAFGLKVRKVAAKERERRVMEALAAVRMDHLADRRPNQLSGGQQQRVALARALVVRPSVLLLDEPLSNLDAALRVELRSEIRRVCKEAGITTLYVTHDQKEALSIADRIAVLDKGRVAQLGTPRQLYQRPQSRFVAQFISHTNILPASLAEGPGTPAGLVRVRTDAGELLVTPAAPSPSAPSGADQGMFVSIRPESLRLIDRSNLADLADPPSALRGNILHGRVVNRSYLGETEEITVELEGADGAPTPARTAVRVLRLGAHAEAAGDRSPAFTSTGAVLHVDPGDAVLLSS